jgi:hypothetical protein
VISAQAQLTITGMLKDTAQTTVSSATLMLLNPKDSTLVNFSTSDAKGNFIFRNIRKTNYLLKVSHIAYMPKEILINPTENKEISLGVVELNPIAGFLMEVVIKEAKAPIFIKGDTVEYDATIQTNRNQSYINYSAHINAKWQVFKKTYLEGNYRFTNHTNKKLDLKQDLHILNLSVRQVIGKKNQWELRATAVDLLNQTKSITQNATANYIEYRTAPTLARYFMLTVSYNLKGFEVKKMR